MRNGFLIDHLLKTFKQYVLVDIQSDEEEGCKYFFRVSKNTFEHICSLVRGFYIRPPSGLLSTIEGRLLGVEKQVAIRLRMEEIVCKFDTLFGLLNCCGANIDETRIIMALPAVETSDDWCDLEKNHCMFLQGIGLHEMRFLDIVKDCNSEASKAFSETRTDFSPKRD